MLDHIIVALSITFMFKTSDMTTRVTKCNTQYKKRPSCHSLKVIAKAL